MYDSSIEIRPVEKSALTFDRLCIYRVDDVGTRALCVVDMVGEREDFGGTLRHIRRDPHCARGHLANGWEGQGRAPTTSELTAELRKGKDA